MLTDLFKHDKKLDACQVRDSVIHSPVCRNFLTVQPLWIPAAVYPALDAGRE